MGDYKKKLGDLADKIKNDPAKIPIQQVTPVKAVTPALVEEEQARFNNWIPKGLKKEVKAYGVQHDISQKDITIMALTDFLKARGVKLN